MCKTTVPVPFTHECLPKVHSGALHDVLHGWRTRWRRGPSGFALALLAVLKYHLVVALVAPLLVALVLPAVLL